MVSRIGASDRTHPRTVVVFRAAAIRWCLVFKALSASRPRGISADMITIANQNTRAFHTHAEKINQPSFLLRSSTYDETCSCVVKKSDMDIIQLVATVASVRIEGIEVSGHTLTSKLSGCTYSSTACTICILY